jgi:AraC-like DNA-binding protein
VPAAAAAWLLEGSAAASGAEDFALRLSERRRLATLGPLSVVLREEPDLGSALLLLIRHERSYNEAVSLRLTETGGLATLRIELTVGAPAPSRQALELAVAAVHGIVRELRGPAWHAQAVCFRHPAPMRVGTHRRLFGPRLRFGCEFTGLVVRAAELASVNVLADPLMRPYRAELLRVVPAPPARTLPDQVRELVETLLPVGGASMGRVARSLGLTARTLRRRLERDGAGYSAIVDDVRAASAERYLADDRLSLTDITAHLGFVAPSAFSRWFRRRFGISPTAWRQAAHAPRLGSRASRRLEAAGPEAVRTGPAAGGTQEMIR